MKTFTLSNLLKNHPNSAVTLFWVELWSAFARHGLRSLFVLYVTSELLFKDSDAYFLYGTFGSLMFLTPLLGGILADRYLGAAHVVILGCLTMLAGVLCLLLEPLFYTALALIILGYGFIKTNVSSLLGQMYPTEQKQERETGYGYMYVCTNIGALSAPMICGFFGETYGWNYGFLIMALALTLSTVLFLKSFSHFHDCSHTFKWRKSFTIYSLLLSAIFGITLFLEHAQWMDFYGLFLLFILTSPMVYIAFRCEGEERAAILQIILVFAVSILVTALGEQSGSSLNLFVNRFVDRNFAGYTIPTSWFMTLNPIFVVLLSPLIAQFWKTLLKKQIRLTLLQKMTLGVGIQGSGFYLFSLGGDMALHGLISPLWIVSGYFLDAFGELLVFPIGTAFVSQYAPKRYTHTLMGLFFVATAFGFYLGSLIATECASPDSSAEVLYSTECIALYGQTFFKIALFSCSLSLGLGAFLAVKHFFYTHTK